MRAGGIDAQGLVDASEEADRRTGEVPLDADRDWFYARLRDMHDLWHVLTGYGRDLAGEATLLAFTHAQTRNRGIARDRAGRDRQGSEEPRPRLAALPVARLAARPPLGAAARRALGGAAPAAARRGAPTPGVSPPEEAHPGGILVAENESLRAAAS